MQPDRSGQGSVTPTEGQPGTQWMGIGCRPLPAPCWLPGARGLGGPHAGKISRQPLHWRGTVCLAVTVLRLEGSPLVFQ